jgi:hypothetical protein
MLVIATLLAVLNGALVQSETRRPDFSGSWTFDAQKTMTPDKDGRVVLAAMLGEEFTAIQDATSLTLRILNNGQLVVAVYDLTGRSSENVSPGDIVVTSRAKWDGDRLLISSTSTSDDKGKQVTVETTRALSIDSAGDLIIERTGTPKRLVTPSRSVYRRTKK